MPVACPIPRSGGDYRKQADELLTGPRKLRATLVEHLGNRAPARPPGHRPLLARAGRTAVTLNGTQRGQRSDIGADPADGARRGQVVLAGGTEGG